MSEIDYSTGALMEAINNKVDLDGVQTITGVKTIETTNEKALKLKANDIDSSYIPLTDVHQGIIEFLDSNGINLGYLFAHNLSNGEQRIGIQSHRVIDGVDKYASINCGVNGSGEPYTSAITPANTSNSTSIATTAWVKNILSSSGVGLATISKSGNGYIQFTNGFQVCWGYGTYKSEDTISFAKAFTTNSRVFPVVGPNITTSTLNCTVNTLTKTNFKIVHNVSGTGTTNIMYIAVGY